MALLTYDWSQPDTSTLARLEAQGGNNVAEALARAAAIQEREQALAAAQQRAVMEMGAQAAQEARLTNAARLKYDFDAQQAAVENAQKAQEQQMRADLTSARIREIDSQAALQRARAEHPERFRAGSGVDFNLDAITGLPEADAPEQAGQAAAPKLTTGGLADKINWLANQGQGTTPADALANLEQRSPFARATDFAGEPLGDAQDGFAETPLMESANQFGGDFAGGIRADRENSDLPSGKQDGLDIAEQLIQNGPPADGIPLKTAQKINSALLPGAPERIKLAFKAAGPAGGAKALGMELAAARKAEMASSKDEETQSKDAFEEAKRLGYEAKDGYFYKDGVAHLWSKKSGFYGVQVPKKTGTEAKAEKPSFELQATYERVKSAVPFVERAEQELAGKGKTLKQLSELPPAESWEWLKKQFGEQKAMELNHAAQVSYKSLSEAKRKVGPTYQSAADFVKSYESRYGAPQNAAAAAAAGPAVNPSAEPKVFKDEDEARSAGAKSGDIVMMINPATGKPARARLD